MLRLFNDCIAMMLLHAAMAALLCRKWHLGLVIFRYQLIPLLLLVAFLLAAHALGSVFPLLSAVVLFL